MIHPDRLMVTVNPLFEKRLVDPMVPDPANLRVDPLLEKVLADWIVPAVCSVNIILAVFGDSTVMVGIHTSYRGR